MLELINKFILSKNLQFERGEIKLLGTNICLIPPEVYLEFLKELQKSNLEEILYESSFKSGVGWFETISKSTGKTDKKELIEFIPKILDLLALGEIKIIDFNFEKKKATAILKNSLNAELYGTSKVPVDLQFCGYLAGAFTVIFSSKVKCKEVKCKAMGEDFCEFTIWGDENV